MPLFHSPSSTEQGKNTTEKSWGLRYRPGDHLPIAVMCRADTDLSSHREMNIIYCLLLARAGRTESKLKPPPPHLPSSTSSLQATHWGTGAFLCHSLIATPFPCSTWLSPTGCRPSWAPLTWPFQGLRFPALCSDAAHPSALPRTGGRSPSSTEGCGSARGAPVALSCGALLWASPSGLTQGCTAGSSVSACGDWLCGGREQPASPWASHGLQGAAGLRLELLLYSLILAAVLSHF